LSSSSTPYNHVHGFTALRQYLLQQKQSDLWSSAPLFYLQNQGPSASSTTTTTTRTTSTSTSNVWSLQQTGQQVQMILTQHCNFRTVVAAPTTTIGCPVRLSQIDQQLTLATRTGASSNGVVVAVGSGTIMDLAKAITTTTTTTVRKQPTERNNDDNPRQRPQLLLVPATYGAVMAAASPQALVFDPAEQAIVVVERSLSSPATATTTTTTTSTSTTIATLEAARMDPRGRSEAICAALALALDRLWQQPGVTNDCGDNNNNNNNNGAAGAGIELSSLISIVSSNVPTDRAAQALQQQQHDQNHQRVIQALLSAGANLSFGMDGTQNRSIPLALATSLVPQHFFADQHFLTIMASLAPALLELVLENSLTKARLEDALWLSTVDHESNNNHDEETALRTVAQLERVVTTNAPRLVTNHSLDDLLAAVRDNQFLWNSYDVSEHVLRRVLRDHVLV